jgi:hypothetical protein
MHDIIVDPKVFLSDYVDTRDYSIRHQYSQEAKAAIEWKWSPFSGSSLMTASYVPLRLGGALNRFNRLDIIEGLPNINNVLSMTPRKGSWTYARSPAQAITESLTQLQCS